MSFGTDRWYLQDFDNRDTWYIGVVEALDVPEPTTAILLSACMIGLLARPRKLICPRNEPPGRPPV